MHQITEIDSNYLNDTTDERIIIISKYDEIGNWVAFICKRIEGKILCGGHIGLNQPVAVILKWMNEMRIKKIEVIVDEEWFLKFR